MNIVWQPQKKQEEFQARNEYEVLYGGSAGGGKSDALLCEALRQVDKKEYRALILRKTVPQLRELIDRSQTLYSKAFSDAVYKSMEHVWQFSSGAKIYFGSMHHQTDRFAYQGRRFDFIAFDELTHFTAEEYFYMFSRNRPSAPNMRIYIRATANPGGIGHSWVKNRFIDPAPPLTPIKSELNIVLPNGESQTKIRERIFVPSTVFDNKALMQNAPNYIASLAMLPEAERKALLYGDWNSFSGQVFSELKTNITNGIGSHVIEKRSFPPNLPVYRSFDFGFSKPFAVAWFIVQNNIIYNVYEYYGSQNANNVGIKLNPEQIANNIRQIETSHPLLKNRQVIGIADPSIFDESRGKSIAQMMEQSPNFIYFIRGDNTRLAGKMQVHKYLKFDKNNKPSIYFFKTCTNMLRTLQNLIYSESNVEDVDTSVEDHMYDCLRYFLMYWRKSGEIKSQSSNILCKELDIVLN